MKKLLALLLAVTMVVAVFAGCQEAKPNTTTGPAATDPTGNGKVEITVEEVNGNFTYTDWVTTLSANWNPHTYETADQSYPIDFLTAGLYTFLFNDELKTLEGKDAYEGYVIVPEMAAAMPVDVTEAIKASHPQFGISETATEGFAYKIALNPKACWEDGTPITADDYIESMKRLLDPKLKNYRANGYYEGSFDITGAEEYANQGAVVKKNNSADGETMSYEIADLVKGDDGVYTTPEGYKCYFGLNVKYKWMGGSNALSAYYGAGYIPDDGCWAILSAAADEEGYVPVTDETMAALHLFTGSDIWGNEPVEQLGYYVSYDYTYATGLDFSTVGLFKSGDYEITIVLDKSLIGFTLWYNLTGNWLVKTDLYDECLKETVSETGSVWTSTYNTSVETTCSYGPYKMTDYQTDKGMHFVKNEKWYGYSDDVHVYKDPEDGKYYRMYQTTEIDCQVVAEVATAKMMFLKGELMQYGLQSEDFNTYRYSEYCHFTPGQATFFLLLNGHMNTIKEREAAADFDQATTDLETMTLISFHRAMGLAFDKAEFVETQSPADSVGMGLIGGAYIYDAESGATYRGTDEAKQVLCEVYGVDVSKFASLDDAVASITGYDPVQAKEWFQKAYDEAIEAGYITDNDGDGISDQTVTLTYSASAVSEKLEKRLDYMTEAVNKTTEGTPFEGKIKFIASAPLGNEWSSQFKAGLTDTCLGGWTGSMMDPFGLIEVYTNPTYQYDAEWWDSTSVNMTLTLDGEEITMNLSDWTLALNGNEVTVGDKVYNFGEGQTSADNRLAILAGIEKEVLLTYNYLPFLEEGSMALLSMKAYYVIEDYNPVMGRGGITYLKYNYTDEEWNAYVAEQGGELSY